MFTKADNFDILELNKLISEGKYCFGFYPSEDLLAQSSEGYYPSLIMLFQFYMSDASW